MIHLLTRFFPLWAILLSAIAFFHPTLFVVLKPAIIPLLSVVMFCMGMTLKWSDFKETVRSPKIILIGVLLQYSVMPLSAFLISKSFDLSPELIAGMVLVGSSAGGTASNVICYLARGNVALSITLTLVSSLIAVFAMPALSLLYLHQIVPVPFLKMLLSILQMVLMPVLVGTTLNTFLGARIKKIGSVFPFISTIVIVVIIAIVIGLNQAKLKEVGFIIICAVLLHNLSGLVIGFWLPKSLGYDNRTCRTLSIEVGMQNSGLSVALAIKHFSVMAAIPGAIFSIWHNLSGSFLAGYWNFSKSGGD
ncbi:MAG: bile acid:sodium symporter family protein [Planctomycetes bacterium]|nr:bile acid:sodium symporter family protein [Planctomycetota bacterium]